MPVIQLSVPAQSYQRSITVRLNTDKCHYPAYCILRRVAFIKPSIPGMIATSYSLNDVNASTSSLNVSNYVSPYWLKSNSPVGVTSGLLPDAVTNVITVTTNVDTVQWIRGTIIPQMSKTYDLRLESEAWAQLHIDKQLVLTQKSAVANTEVETGSNSYSVYLNAHEQKEIGIVTANLTSTGSNRVRLNVVPSNTDYTIVSFLAAPHVMTLQVKNLAQVDADAHTLYPFSDERQIVNVHEMHRVLGRVDTGGDIFIELTFDDLSPHELVVIPDIQMTFEMMDSDM